MLVTVLDSFLLCGGQIVLQPGAAGTAAAVYIAGNEFYDACTWRCPLALPRALVVAFSYLSATASRWAGGVNATVVAYPNNGYNFVSAVDVTVRESWLRSSWSAPKWRKPQPPCTVTCVVWIV